MDLYKSILECEIALVRQFCRSSFGKFMLQHVVSLTGLTYLPHIMFAT